jgi:tetratricopeptide (TPR) repeat protein
MGWRLVSIVVALAALCAVGATLVFARRERQFRSELRQAARDQEAGRLALARTRLISLVAVRPGDGEAEYRLGLCEKSRGNLAAAIAAWSRVPRDHPFAIKAAVQRAQVLIDESRLSDAEAILETLPRADGDGGSEVRQALELLYRFEGRAADVRRMIVESWIGSATPSVVLRRIYKLDHSAYPVDLVRGVLARGRSDDDRVALGLANLALRSGRLDEASRQLAACLRRRPADPAVWHSALDLAVASGNVAAVWNAAEHLPAEALSDTERLRLRAWLAGRLADPKSEADAWSAVAREEPGYAEAWDRLAELAVLQGRSDEAERFRREKSKINTLRARYDALLDRDDRAKSAAELARLATALGRLLEAKGWVAVEKGTAGRNPLEQSQSANAADRSMTLAVHLADLKPGSSVARKPEAALGAVDVTPSFTDDAEPGGLRFVYDNGHTRKNPPPPEGMGGGVALLDYDGDGWLDVYVVQAGAFPAGPAAGQPGDRLFRNKGDGAFEDVSETSGVEAFARGYSHGVSVGDVDNDGRPDLFVTRWRSYALYRNRGDGRFEDVTESAGLAGDRDWPTSSAFADLDGDGDLDLYVCHYLVYDPANPRRCSHPEAREYHECSPRDFESLPDHVFRNDGGRFVDVTAEAGFTDPHGRGLGVVAADLDDDGKVDLYVANDMSANYLFRNLGGFHFEETALLSGAAGSANGDYQSGMGVACGDVDGDGRPDLAVTNFFGESTTLFQNLGGGTFSDRTTALGLAAPSRFLLGFGVAFLDVNNDAWLDLMSVNGHIYDRRPQFPWTMPVQLLVGSEGGHLRDVTQAAGAPFQVLRMGRGLAVGDLDNDGRPDALVLGQNEPLAYFHNRSDTGHFVTFALEGRKSNRDGVGSRVAIEVDGRRLVAQRFGGGSYQSAGDPRLHFGLGRATEIRSVEVRWPSGHIDRYRSLRGDTGYQLREGDAEVHPLRGWNPSLGHGSQTER